MFSVMCRDDINVDDITVGTAQVMFTMLRASSHHVIQHEPAQKHPRGPQRPKAQKLVVLLPSFSTEASDTALEGPCRPCQR